MTLLDMARYEFNDEKSSKFWEIEMSGSEVTTRWGKIGTDGQSKTKELGDEAAARKEYDKLVKSKTKKGYVLAEDGAEESTTSVAAGANAELEAVIEANLSDPDAYLVYADWLQEQGDPRGEFIALQNKLRENPDDANAKKASDAFLAANQGALCGDFAEALAMQRGYRKDKFVLELEWFMGFIKSVNFETGYYDRAGNGTTEDAVKIFSSIINHPSGRFIQSIEVGDIWTDEMLDFSEIANALGNGPKTLRKLSIERSEFDISGVTCDVGMSGAASPFSGGCPNLREVLIEAGDLSIGKVNLPEVRDFRLQSGGLPASTVKEVAAATWPKLTTLHLWLGDEEYGASASIEDLGPIFEGKNLPSVTHLGLMNTELSNEICEALPGAAIAAQLEVLDLSMGTMTTEGAQALVNGKSSFPNLKRLNVDDNSISEEGQALLKDFCAEVTIGDQEDEEDRYVSVGE